MFACISGSQPFDNFKKRIKILFGGPTQVLNTWHLKEKEKKKFLLLFNKVTNFLYIHAAPSKKKPQI